MTRPNGITTNYGYDSVSHLLLGAAPGRVNTLDGASYNLRCGRESHIEDELPEWGNLELWLRSAVRIDPKSPRAVVPRRPTVTAQSGNRLSSLGVPTYDYNSSNELTSNTSGSYTYDANGNTLSDASGKSIAGTSRTGSCRRWCPAPGRWSSSTTRLAARCARLCSRCDAGAAAAGAMTEAGEAALW